MASSDGFPGGCFSTPTSVPGKATEHGASAWVSATHVGDQEEVPSSSLETSPAPMIWGLNQDMQDLCLTGFQTFQIKIN